MKNNNHPIKVWLRDTGRSQTWLAARAGIHRKYLWQIIHGARIPSAILAQRLSDLTAGQVPVKAIRK